MINRRLTIVERLRLRTRPSLSRREWDKLTFGQKAEHSAYKLQLEKDKQQLVKDAEAKAKREKEEEILRQRQIRNLSLWNEARSWIALAVSIIAIGVSIYAITQN